MLAKVLSMSEFHAGDVAAAGKVAADGRKAFPRLSKSFPIRQDYYSCWLKTLIECNFAAFLRGDGCLEEKSCNFGMLMFFLFRTVGSESCAHLRSKIINHSFSVGCVKPIQDSLWHLACTSLDFEVGKRYQWEFCGGSLSGFSRHAANRPGR